MKTLIIVLVCTIPGFIIGCRVASILAWQFHKNDTWKRGRKEPDGEQWFGAGLWGILAAAVWPLTLTALVFRKWLFSPPREVTLKQREREIERLERELNIR